MDVQKDRRAAPVEMPQRHGWRGDRSPFLPILVYARVLLDKTLDYKCGTSQDIEVQEYINLRTN